MKVCKIKLSDPCCGNSEFELYAFGLWEMLIKLMKFRHVVPSHRELVNKTN